MNFLVVNRRHKEQFSGECASEKERGYGASSCQAVPLGASKQALTTLWCVASGRLGDRRGWGDYYSDWGGGGATVTLTCGRGMDKHIAKGDAYSLCKMGELEKHN